MNKPLVSVIIPTRNSKRTIETVLQSIKAQTYPKIESVVVDQYSTDGTIEIAKKYTKKIFFTKPDKFYSAPPVSRNLGARESRGKYLYHIDSDMELSPTVIEKCVQLMKKNPEVQGIKIHEKDKGSGFWSRAKALERKFYVGYDAIEAARFLRRKVFFDLGGYDESLRSSEDWDFSQRIAKIGKIKNIRPFITHHLGQMSYFYQIKKKFQYGLTLENILKKHKIDIQHQIALVFRSTYFKNWKLFLKDPLGTLGFLILRSSEIAAYIAGMIWARIIKLKL
jgi:glycosyltransferase involved in cell wall biosynthesis